MKRDDDRSLEGWANIIERSANQARTEVNGANFGNAMKLPCELCPHPIYPHQHDYIEVATVLHWVAGNYNGDKKLSSKYYHKQHAPTQEARHVNHE